MPINNAKDLLRNSVTKRIYKAYRHEFKTRIFSWYRKFETVKEGFNLFGYFTYAFGLGETARQFAKQVEMTNIEFGIHDVSSRKHSTIKEEEILPLKPYFQTNNLFKTNIFFLTGELLVALNNLRPESFVKRYNVAVFFWEFDDHFHFPKAFKLIDEVVVFTRFVETALKRSTPPSLKVTRLPILFTKNWAISEGPEQVRSSLGIKKEEFVFIFNFDFFSVYERKNPEAILKAFEIAFTKDDNVRLLLKSVHGAKFRSELDKLGSAIDKMRLKEKVIYIDKTIPRNSFMSMINASDCYISLHRSEGLGMGMMEAMAMGKPVIATGYSGNLDFMNDDNSLLVDYQLIPVEKDVNVYKKGWLWADADVEQAATYMRNLYTNRSLSQELGKKAKDHIDSEFSSENFIAALNNWVFTLK